MSKYVYGSSSARSEHSGIPLVVANYLKDGAPEGERNNTLHYVAQQVRDMGHSEEEAVSILLPRAMADGLRESEIKQAIHSAFTHAARPPASKPGKGNITQFPGTLQKMRAMVGGNTTLQADRTKSIKPDYTLTEAPLPEPLEDPTRRYLKCLFRAGENIQVVRAEVTDGNGKETPAAGFQVIKSLEYWLEQLDKKGGDSKRAIFYATDPHGHYVCINPLGEPGKGRKYENVTGFRHALIEFDNLPRNHQWQLIEQSKIPCVAVVDSGGKSIHAIVRVDAADVTEYKQRVKMLVDHFEEYGVDAQNIDPTRLSRLPGAIRGDTGNQQTLLAEKMGYSTFAEWETNVIHDKNLPPQITVEELEAFDPKNDPDSVIGDRWLCKGASFILIGQSGIGKSSFTMQMAISLRLGKNFFGIKPDEPMKVMIIQAENDKGDLAEAYQGIVKGMQLSDDEKAILRTNLIFFRDTVHTGKDFIDMATRLIEKHRPDIVFADPLLSFIGGDISDQVTASIFLRNQLAPLLLQSGVVWVWIHHTGKPKEQKGDQTEKDLAYLGLGSSELTNSAREIGILQKVSGMSDGNMYRFTLCKRGGRSGLVDQDGLRTFQIELQHAKGRICWERADMGDVEFAREVADEKQKGYKSQADVLVSPKEKAAIQAFLEQTAGCSMDELVAASGRIFKRGRTNTRKRLNKLFEEDLIRVVEPVIPGGAKQCYWNGPDTGVPNEVLTDTYVSVATDDEPPY